MRFASEAVTAAVLSALGEFGVGALPTLADASAMRGPLWDAARATSGADGDDGGSDDDGGGSGGDGDDDGDDDGSGGSDGDDGDDSDERRHSAPLNE